jgi:folate-binding protein YgfZ
MTINTLPYLGVIRFTGADAATFLQGQLSNDTRRLAAGAPLLAAYSTPQGRVVAMLRLIPHSTGILAILPREMVLPTMERLRKFVLRAKVKIEDVSDQWSVAGYHGADALRADGFEPPAAAAAEHAAPEHAAPDYAERDGVGIARVGANDDRYWVVGPAAGPDLGVALAEDAPAGGAPVEVAPAGLARSAEQAWRLADIRAGSPQVYAATSEMFVAQMLNLDRLDGISFTKGCYTGQEIIARTQHLGRIKRRLYRLRLPAGTWAIGQAIQLRDGRTGRLTEVAAAADGVEALAVLPLAAGSAGAAGAAGDGDSAAASAESTASASTVVDAIELPLPYTLTEEG